MLLRYFITLSLVSAHMVFATSHHVQNAKWKDLSQKSDIWIKPKALMKFGFFDANL
jgi:hypothetical protein